MKTKSSTVVVVVCLIFCFFLGFMAGSMVRIDMPVEKEAYGSASIFGFHGVDPYENMRYYIFHDLTPGSVFNRLPITMRTSLAEYLIENYEPENREFGFEYLKYSVFEDNELVGEYVLKYEPTHSGGASFAYNAKLQIVKPDGFTEVTPIV